MSRNYKNIGFSLLETLVAISVLTVALLGAYSLTSFGVSRASLAKNQNIAFFLAQEAAEYASNQRLNNTLQGGDWLNGFDACRTNDGCYVDAVNNSISPCSGGSCPKIRFDPGTGYNYQSGNETVFQRKVKIETVDAAREIKLKVEMSWREREQTRSFIIEDRLFNWSS